MKKEIDIYKLFEGLNLSEKESLKFASRIMLNLALNTGKSEYNEIYIKLKTCEKILYPDKVVNS